MQNEIDALLSLKRPTGNHLTDAFGIHRHWGNGGWNPDKEYSPVHLGTADYSAHPAAAVSAPGSGLVYGEFVDGPVGSCTSFRPRLADGSITTRILVYLIHCEPTASNWEPVEAGQAITHHAGHGIGAPHLHVEVVMTPDLARSLQHQGLLSRHAVTREWLAFRARSSGLNDRRVLERVNDRLRAWGVTALYHDAIVLRGPLPRYKRSQYSDVGRGLTWVVDLNAIQAAAGSGKQWAA